MILLASPPLLSSGAALPVPLLPHPQAQVQADLALHGWCDSVGIPVSPSVRLRTTPESVAGRGVFSVLPLREGEVVARIPTACVLHPENAAGAFPAVAEELGRARAAAASGGGEGGSGGGSRRRDGFRRRISALWDRAMRRRGATATAVKDGEEDGGEWQAELTRYALAAVDEGHPWGEWISQWNRDDPVHGLFRDNVRADDEDAVLGAVGRLREMLPLPGWMFRGALAIRLGRLEAHRSLLGLADDVRTSEMYSVLGSRAMDLGDGITGVMPFYDMINHSLRPNLSLDCEGEWFELYANCDVDAGEEVFLCYTKLDDPMTETNALWALVQWGIPTPSEDIVDWGSAERR